MTLLTLCTTITFQLLIGVHIKGDTNLGQKLHHLLRRLDRHFLQLLGVSLICFSLTIVNNSPFICSSQHLHVVHPSVNLLSSSSLYVSSGGEGLISSNTLHHSIRSLSSEGLHEADEESPVLSFEVAIWNRLIFLSTQACEHANVVRIIGCKLYKLVHCLIYITGVRQSLKQCGKCCAEVEQLISQHLWIYLSFRHFQSEGVALVHSLSLEQGGQGELNIKRCSLLDIYSECFRRIVILIGVLTIKTQSILQIKVHSECAELLFCSFYKSIPASVSKLGAFVYTIPSLSLTFSQIHLFHLTKDLFAGELLGAVQKLLCLEEY